jgi:cold shock CspA family protein
MLISWDFSYHNENGDMVETKTSRQLMEEVFYPVYMAQRIDQNGNETIKNLFVPDRMPDRQPLPLFTKNEIEIDTAPETSQEENVSVIFNINLNGFGFIKDEDRNNIFFHYSTVANRDFSELQAGMKVKYLLEEDIERSKRDEAPRYRASKVTVID